MRADAALAAGFEAAFGLDEWAIPLLLPPAPLGADLVAIVANAHPTGSPAALPRTNTEQLLLASLADSGGATAMLLACVGIDAGHLRTRLLLASGPSLGSDVLLPALSAAAQASVTEASHKTAAELRPAAGAAQLLRAIALCCDGIGGSVLLDCGLEPGQRAQAA